MLSSPHKPFPFVLISPLRQEMGKCQLPNYFDVVEQIENLLSRNVLMLSQFVTWDKSNWIIYFGSVSCIYFTFYLTRIKKKKTVLQPVSRPVERIHGAKMVLKIFKKQTAPKL